MYRFDCLLGHAENYKTSAIGVRDDSRIKELQALDNFKLKILFDDGKKVLYDVKDDISAIDDFKIMESQTGLWNNVQLDKSRTCVYWNDRIDLPSDGFSEDELLDLEKYLRNNAFLIWEIAREAA